MGSPKAPSNNMIVRSGSLFALYNWVLAIVLVFFNNQALPAGSEVKQLAAEAKQRFIEVMQPPIFKTPLVEHPFLEATAPHRDYVVKSFNKAIDALVAEAESPERMSIVENAMRDFITYGETEAMNQVFAEMLEHALADKKSFNPQAAAALRHSVALFELPIALQPTTLPKNSPRTVSPFVSLSLSGAISKTGTKPVPDPTKTIKTYLNADKVDYNGHLWTWIVLANLVQDPQLFEYALSRAKEISMGNHDMHNLVFVKLELGRLENNFGRPEKALHAYLDAVDISSKGLHENPTDDHWQQDLASALMGLGQLQGRDAAQSVLCLSTAVDLRNDLVAKNTGNARLRLELAVTHLSLSYAILQLPNTDTNLSSSRKHRIEAERIYYELIEPDKWKPTVDLDPGHFLIGFIWAAGVTIAIGFSLFVIYRRRIARWMREASSVKPVKDTGSGDTTNQIRDQVREIEFANLESRIHPKEVSFTSVQMAIAHRHFRRATWTYILGGITFAVITAMAGLFWWTYIRNESQIEFNFARLLSGFILLCLIYVWSLVIVLWLVWGPDRRRLAVTLVVYFGILLAVCVHFAFSDIADQTFKVFGISVPSFFQPFVEWLLTLYPSLYLLMFLNRHIRALGSVFLVLLMTLFAGAILIWLLGSSREMERVMGISLSDHFFWWQQVVGALLLVPFGGWLGRGICRGYEKKLYSEMTLSINSIWLFEALNVSFSFSAEKYGYLLGLAAFAGYKAATYLGLRPLAQEALRTEPARLLLLRVFGFRPRTERLFKLLEARWRYAGPIQLISAPDLASSTANPGDLLSFISGKLRNQFIIEPADIEQRLSTMDYAPDSDGRYRVNKVFCGNDSWRPVVQYLMASNDIVVMDLRSFSAKNQGCLFELQALVDFVPFDRMVLLVDDKTDTGLLSQTLTARWQQTDRTSPNAQGKGIISVLKVGQRDEVVVDTLLEIADTRLCSGDEASSLLR